MKIALLIVAGVAALALVVLLAYAGGLPRDLREKKLDQRVPVDLDGVASAALPPTFARQGVVNAGERQWFGGELTALEHHLDERRLTFRFVQGQHSTLGGYKASPVIMDVTLFNTNVAREEIERVSTTTIDRFYSPDNKTTLASAQWQPEIRDGDAVTRIGQAVDPYDAKHGRWLIVHTDAARRTRVDLFAWREAYTVDEAQGLVRDVAGSVTTTSALQHHFEDIKNFDQRMELRRDSVIAAVSRDLALCRLSALVAGSTVASDECIARLSENRRDVFIARYLGRVPLSAATRGSTGVAPEFPLAFGPGDYRGYGSINGLPNLNIFLLWWDDQSNTWRTGMLQGFVDAADESVVALEAEVASRLTARDHAHLFRYVHYDVVFHPDRVNAAEWLREGARYQNDLASGKIITGVQATKAALGNR